MTTASTTGATVIYKIVPQEAWRAAEMAGRFFGAGVDLQDGYIHFSTAAQVRETAARHFAGRGDLLLVAVSVSALHDALRWEPSRGGAVFPHLYGPLALDAVLRVTPLPVGPGGHHEFPAPDAEWPSHDRVVTPSEPCPSPTGDPNVTTAE